MPFAQPESLRRELAHALPDRPFALRFWDGSELAPTRPAGLSSRSAPRPRSRTCCVPRASSGWDAPTPPASSKRTTSTA